MPPYASTPPLLQRGGMHMVHPNHNLYRRSMSTTNSISEPLMKRYLSQIPERFVRFQDSVQVHEYEYEQQPFSCSSNRNHKKRNNNNNNSVATTSASDVWYSAQELAQFRQAASYQARLLHKRGSTERGLELQTTQGFQRCYKNRLCAMAIVLELQYSSASSSSEDNNDDEYDPANEYENMPARANTMTDDDYCMDGSLQFEIVKKHSVVDKIAQAYAELTQHCVLEAMEVALQDEMEAQRLLDDDDDDDDDENDELQCEACLDMPQWLSVLLRPSQHLQQQRRLLMTG